MTPAELGKARRYVADILSEMHRVDGFLDGLDFDTFASDPALPYAAHYALVVIGEAAKRVPPAAQSRCPEVDCRGMAGMRDSLTHNYSHVDPRFVWATAKERFPVERPALERLLDEVDGALNA